MNFPDDTYRSIVELPFEFNAIRVYDASLNPATFEISITVSPAEFETRLPNLIEEKSNEGMQRLTFWWETIMSNVVIGDIASETFAALVASADNSSMFCPGEPTDHLLVELLHSKVSAIMNGFFDIHTLSLKSNDTSYIKTSFRNIDGYRLPDISYYPNETLHDKPWWQRDTIEVCEFVKGSVIEDELYNHFSDIFGKKEADIIIFRADDDENGQV